MVSHVLADPVNGIDPSGLLPDPLGWAEDRISDAADATGVTDLANNAASFYADLSTNPHSSFLEKAVAWPLGMLSSTMACGNAGKTMMTLILFDAAANVVGRIAEAKKLPLVTVGKIAVHGPKHRFPLIGKRRHIQANFWVPGMEGSGWNPPRIPLP